MPDRKSSSTIGYRGQWHGLTDLSLLPLVFSSVPALCTDSVALLFNVTSVASPVGRTAAAAAAQLFCARCLSQEDTTVRLALDGLPA